jgi:hypothetical protein
MYRINIYLVIADTYIAFRIKIHVYLFCFGLQWHYTDLYVTYILERLQKGYYPNSQYDEDIKPMNGIEAHTKKKWKIKIFTRFCNLPPERARVDDQDGRYFGTLFLW